MLRRLPSQGRPSRKYLDHLELTRLSLNKRTRGRAGPPHPRPSQRSGPWRICRHPVGAGTPPVPCHVSGPAVPPHSTAEAYCGIRSLALRACRVAMVPRIASGLAGWGGRTWPIRGSTGGRGSRRNERPSSARERRNRMLIAGGAIVAVVAIVLGFVLAGGNRDGGSGAAAAARPRRPARRSPASSPAITSVPAATLDKVGGGATTSPPKTISGAALTSGGKPEMLYIGAEYCPYCAAERWAMIVALSRFGTLSGLGPRRSAAANGAGQAEPYPNTATWTFAHASYASKYLTFTPVERYTNVPDPATGGYTPLQTPTAEQQALLTKYDAANQRRDPVHRLREQVPERRRLLRPRRAGRADLERRSPPTCITPAARSPRACSAPPTTSPRRSAGSRTTSPRPRARRPCGRCRRRSRRGRRHARLYRSDRVRATQRYLSGCRTGHSAPKSPYDMRHGQSQQDEAGHRPARAHRGAAGGGSAALSSASGSTWPAGPSSPSSSW